MLNQTFPSFEILLIDNNSTDNSLAIAKTLAGKDSRIRLLNETKQGVDHAMNCGLENSRGRFIARMDADDISFPERLEKQIRFLKENPGTGLVGTAVKYVAHNTGTGGFRRFVKWVNSFHTSEEIELYRFVEIPVVNPTILFRRELFEKLGTENASPTFQANHQTNLTTPFEYRQGTEVPILTSVKINKEGEVSKTISYENIGYGVIVKGHWFGRNGERPVLSLQLHISINDVADDAVNVSKGIKASVLQRTEIVHCLQIKSGEPAYFYTKDINPKARGKKTFKLLVVRLVAEKLE